MKLNRRQFLGGLLATTAAAAEHLGTITDRMLEEFNRETMRAYHDLAAFGNCITLDGKHVSLRSLPSYGESPFETAAAQGPRRIIDEINKVLAS